MSINRVNISGNLTRDSELRTTGAGTAILTFGMAVNDRARNQQTGEWEDRPNFVDCVLFGARAEALARFLSKGTKVALEGKLRYSSWERDGQRRSKLEVVVDEIEFLSPRNNQSQPAAGGPYVDTSAQPAYAAAPAPSAPVYAAPAPAQQPAAPQASPQAAPVQPAAPAPVTSAPPSADVYDEDIPF